ncbi:MAG: MFS transporter [Cardiobacteriaceae bacterium]|nr:MFS transporter [Cardiobacteriaceae bacterium]
MRKPASTTVLLIVNVFVNLGTYLFMPLLALSLLDRGFTKAQAGTVAGLMFGTGLLCAVWLGQWGARFGSRFLAVGGAALRSAALVVFLFPAPYWLCLMGAGATSIGATAAVLGIKSELFRTSRTRKMITLRLLAANIGALLGPALGALLFLVLPFAHLVALTMAIYAALAVLLCFLPFQPPEQQTQTARGSFLATLRGVDRPFALLLAAVFAFNLIMAQWSLTLPVFATAGFGHESASSWMMALSGFLIICLQYLALTKWLAHLPTLRIIRDGFCLLIPAGALLALPPGMAAALAFVVLLTLGELLVMPSLDELTTALRSADITRALGLSGTVIGLGLIVGSSFGGWLMDRFGLPAMALWTMAAALSGIVAARALGQYLPPGKV